MKYGHHIQCPVENCEGFYTTSGSSNLLNHIRGLAKSELFGKFMIGEGKTTHADYLKCNSQYSKENITVFKIGKSFFKINKKPL